MLVAESSCGFPIFGNGKSSRSCGCTDSSRASCSCSNTRSSHSKDIDSLQDAGRIYSPGVTGASGHGVECTCSRSCRCTADVKLSTAAQLSVVTAGLEGAVVQDTWMTSVADEGHLDPPAETSQRRSCQELWCLCKQLLSVFTSWKLVWFMCLCMRVVQSLFHPSIHNVESSVARFLYCTMMMSGRALASVTAVRFWEQFHITSLWPTGIGFLKIPHQQTRPSRSRELFWVQKIKAGHVSNFCSICLCRIEGDDVDCGCVDGKAALTDRAC